MAREGWLLTDEVLSVLQVHTAPPSPAGAPAAALAVPAAAPAAVRAHPFACWLLTNEVLSVLSVLQNFEALDILLSHAAAQKPNSGAFFVYDRRMVKVRVAAAGGSRCCARCCCARCCSRACSCCSSLFVAPVIHPCARARAVHPCR